jgi:hypothetical protein
MTAMLVAAVLAVPRPTPTAALKPFFPRTPVRVLRLCRVKRLSLATARAGRRTIQAVLERVPGGWRVLWLDGRLVRGVSRQRLADVVRVRTSCLAP